MPNCRKNECQVMPYPNPADIARMKEDKTITLLEQPGLNVGYLSLTPRRNHWTTSKYVRR